MWEKPYISIFVEIGALEWQPFLRCLPKHIKISKCYNYNEIDI
jgi:hypothetical protein